MPIYILLSRLSQQGVQTLKSNPDRLREVNKDVEELGCRVLHQWATLGAFDFVNVLDAPDIATVAKVSVALAIIFHDGRPDWVRVALGAVAPTVVRARETEKALMAGGWDALQRAKDAVRAEVRPIDDLRSTAEYRREMAAVLLERAVRRVAEA